MKNNYWIAIAAAVFVVGILFGYALWGPRAGRLADVETELSAAQAQVSDLKKKVADTESNLGKVANEKLSMEKEMADMKEAMEKPAKKQRR